jgi:hypothetical protein
MVNKAPLIAGGLGGALPALIGLINTDAATMFQGFDILVLAGYLVRTALLIGLGCLLVWINSETDIKKALQIGIMAPAVIVGYLNATDLQDAKDELVIAKSNFEASQSKEDGKKIVEVKDSLGINSNSMFSLVSSAYAQSNKTVSVPRGIHRDPSALSRLWYGLSGKSSNGWFVIVGSHKTKRGAESQVSRLKMKGYRAIVFPPFGKNSYYGVMIGSWITLADAKRLKSQAIQDGLPRGTYLWKFRP